MSDSLPAAVFFDHDGTLVDTEPLWARAKEDIAAEHGLVWTEQDTLDCLGRPMSLTLERLQEIGVPLETDELLERLAGDARRLVEETGISFLPGIEPLLEELAAAGIPAAIVTNATAEVARGTAARAPEGLVRTVIGNEDVTRPKPDPQPYLMAAERLGVDPARSVAVEDSPSGAESARAAGMKLVVVPGLQPVPEKLGDLRADHEHLDLAAFRALFD